MKVDKVRVPGSQRRAVRSNKAASQTSTSGGNKANLQVEADAEGAHAHSVSIERFETRVCHNWQLGATDTEYGKYYCSVIIIPRITQQDHSARGLRTKSISNDTAIQGHA